MKTNNSKKIVVSVLALAMGAGVAGSISGSMAWYQYSTRATAQIQGVSAGTTRNLQVRIADGTYGEDGDWVQDLSVEAINAYVLKLYENNNPTSIKLNPATISTSDKKNDSALATRPIPNSENTELDFRGHPVYQYGDLPKAGKTYGEGTATIFNYVEIPLQFRVLDNGKDVVKTVYLVDANFLDANGTGEDITSALRVHISNGTNNYLLSKGTASTNISGALDLNKNNVLDRDGFTGEDTDATAKLINYGNNTASTLVEPTADQILKQASFKASELVADNTDAFAFANKTHPLGDTVIAAENPENQTYLNVKLVIWLEGWSVLDNETGAAGNLWDDKYIGSDFKLQFRFACEANS